MSASSPLDSPAESRSGNTRERLLLTALHLYAQDGLHNVSLRKISTAAGSKNSAAMHYHFRDKLGVIEALVGMIASELEALTVKMRSQTPEQTSLRDAFRRILRPLAALPYAQPWGLDAIQFLSRVIVESNADIAGVVNPLFRNYWHSIDEKLARLVPDMPEELRQLRLMFMSTNAFHGVAEVTALAHTPLGDMSHFENDALLDHLIDYLIGGLMAPSGHAPENTWKHARRHTQ